MKISLGKRAHTIAAVVMLAAALAGCSAGARKDRYFKRAERFYEGGRYQAALVEYMNVLRLDPRHAEALRKAGFCQLRQGDGVRALRFLMGAREVDPDNLEVRLQIGKLLVLARRPDRAREEALFILEKDPRNLDAMLLLVDSSFRPDDLEEALRRLEGLGDFEGEMSYHAALGVLYARKKDFSAAEIAFKRAAEMDPTSARPHESLAQLYRSQGKLEPAEAEYGKAAALAPLVSPTRVNFAAFKLETGKAEEARAVLDEILKEAQRYRPAQFLLARLEFAEKKYNECAGLLDQILKDTPADAEALILRARVRQAQGDAAGAIRDLEKLVEKYPGAAEFRAELALARLAARDMTGAISDLKKSLELDPDAPAPKLLLAELTLRAGDAGSAVEWLEEMVDQQAEAPRVQLLLAAAYRAQGMTDKAVATCRKLMELDPRNPRVYYLLGVLLRQRGKEDEARAAFENALRLDPGSIHSLTQLVVMDASKNDYESALRRVKDRIQASPDSADLRFLQGKLYTLQSEWEKAAEAFREAIKLQPRYLGAYVMLGRIHAATGRESEAMAEVERALEVNPDDVSSLMLAGVLLERQGLVDKACESYERILSKHSGFTPAANNLACLYLRHRKDTERAFQLARQAREAAPDDPFVADTLGWIVYRRGDYKWALSLLRESAERIVDNPEVLYHLGMAELQNGNETVAAAALRGSLEKGGEFPGAEDAARQLSILEIDVGGENTADALARLQDALKADPSNVSALVRCAAIYDGLNKVEDARKCYEAALKANPDFGPALIGAADFNARRGGGREEALKMAERARELMPADPRTAHVLGRLAYLEGNFKWAYSLLKEAADKQPGDVELAYHLGLARYMQGYIEEARRIIHGAVESGAEFADREEARRYLGLIDLYSDPVDPDEALATARETLAADPGSVPARMLAARVFEKKGDRQRAIDEYETVLRTQPGFAPAAADLAALYAAADEKADRAFELASKAREILAEDPRVAALLGRILYGRGNWEWAARLLEESLTKLPDDSESQYYLGLCRLELKDKEGARAALRRFLELDPESSRAEKASRIISQLE